MEQRTSEICFALSKRDMLGQEAEGSDMAHLFPQEAGKEKTSISHTPNVSR